MEEGKLIRPKTPELKNVYVAEVAGDHTGKGLPVKLNSGGLWGRGRKEPQKQNPLSEYENPKVLKRFT